MTAQLIDGKQLALSIRAQIAEEAAQLKKEKGIVPGLAVILAGNDEASRIYVRNKGIACEKAGFHSEQHNLPETVTEEELFQLIDKLNHNKEIHGILVQLPLPKHLNEEKILDAILPEKDADGFHPMNVGNMLLGRPSPLPCTPFGIMKMLESINYPIKGKDAVIVGRSNIVGKPIGILLMREHATITTCHSRTKDLADKVRQADIVVAAIGRAEMVKGDWIKEGAVVLDVGINRREDGKLVGDVEFEAAKERASYITPVPGGVGPMTIAMLLWNTLQAAKKS